MTLKNKMWWLFFSIILFFVVFISTYFIPKYEKLLLQQKALQLESASIQLVTMTQAMLDEGYSKERIINIIQKIRYGTDGREYMFLLNSKGYCIQHPTSPEYNNTFVNEVVDGKGRFLIKEMLSIITSEERKGFIEYTWPWFNDKTRFEPKMAYVNYLSELDLVIVTTAYVNDVYDNIAHSKYISFMLTLIISFVALLVGYFALNATMKSIKQIRDKLYKLCEPDESTCKMMDVEKGDFEDIIMLLNMFIIKLKKTISNTIEMNTVLAKNTARVSSFLTELNANSETGKTLSLTAISSTNNLNDCLDLFSKEVETNVTGIRYVTVASEQLSTIMGEISKQTTNTKLLASDVQYKMNQISLSLQSIITTSSDMDKIITMISQLSSQLSHLAINSGIQEDAECPVVRAKITEVSNEATNTVIFINRVIGTAKEQTVTTVATIKGIFTAISDIISHIINVAASIEEQTVASVDISKNILKIDRNVSTLKIGEEKLNRHSITIREDIERVEDCFEHINALIRQLTPSVIELANVQIEIEQSLKQFKH